MSINEKIENILKEHFSEIKKKKIDCWEKILSESQLPFRNFDNINDSDILSVDPPEPK